MSICITGVMCNRNKSIQLFTLYNNELNKSYLNTIRIGNSVSYDTSIIEPYIGLLVADGVSVMLKLDAFLCTLCCVSRQSATCSIRQEVRFTGRTPFPSSKLMVGKTKYVK